MTWAIAILAHLLLESAFSLLFRRYAARHGQDYFVANAVMYVFTALPFGIAWSIYNGGPQFNFSPQLWGFFALAGLFFAVGNAAAFKANSKIEAAQFSVIASMRAIVVIVVAGYLLAETLRTGQLLGAGLVLAGGVIAIMASNHHRQLNKLLQLNPYTVIAVASTIVLGGAIITEKYLLNNVPLATYLVVGWGFQTFWMVVLAHRQLPTKTVAIIKDGRIWSLLLLGGLRTLGGFCFITALVLSDSSPLVASAAAAKLVLVAIGGYLFLHEKTYEALTVLAAILASVGMVFLILA